MELNQEYEATINQTALDPEITQGGMIKETINWEASIPAGTHTFQLISAYGTGSTRDAILASAVAIGSLAVTTQGMSRTDNVTTLIGLNVPLGTYSCVTIIAESISGSNISGVYAEKIDASVLTVVKALGAKIISTSFAAV